MNQPNLFEARAARDEGLTRTTIKNRDWMFRALELLRKMKLDNYLEATGEEMRHWLLTRGLSAPSSANTWGALTRHAVRQGIIADTQRIKQMVAVKSHARRTPIWRFL